MSKDILYADVLDKIRRLSDVLYDKFDIQVISTRMYTKSGIIALEVISKDEFETRWKEKETHDLVVSNFLRLDVYDNFKIVEYYTPVYTYILPDIEPPTSRYKAGMFLVPIQKEIDNL